MKRLRQLLVLVVLGFLLAGSLLAVAAPATELPPGLQIPEAARPGPDFNADRATDAYVNLLSPEQRAQSDAYFEGGYWLQLWDLLYGLAVAWILLRSGLSRKMRDIGRRMSKRPSLVTMIYVVQWLLIGSLLMLPLTIYSGFFREHAYGLATQTFGEWSVDQLKELLISLIILPVVIALLYGAVRKTGERWWIWATGGAFVLILFFMMIAPVFLDPVFNDYKPLRQGEVREQVLSLARANMIPDNNVVEFDASKQTTRISANVSGFLGTTRVALNDNLLDRTSKPEILAVLGHEMGHYVLNHGLRLVIYMTLILGLGFWVVHRSFDRALLRWGPRFGLEGRADPAALPLALAILSLFFFFATPLTNSVVRQAEAEADAYGLNAAQEPNGFAMAAMRLSTYRKIKPGVLEEIIFYDHPSGYARVHRSMLWLQEHQDNATANAGAQHRQ
ncbi:MAG: M48 family metallopeptidase [Dokdonella sp.]|uniref:M48 family metallopeptidase n=1 Tax=Dokdonella sp. TaxID=2291710 RepID=UPI002CB99A17|nr:M48 family metallopeptidase [Xanthomonadales bacterium]HQV72198.1 M48 family metallopeptidase [Dokdonella sp.]HQW75811.1 M48 family metallopeptidase [Dokdonella sp.]HQX65173.1 M48 family metallopeptidase [Dokdonella sp.]HQY55270.1 M48 family metallopeptidase [Dokdonella sp.]